MLDKALFISIVLLGITLIIIHLFNCARHDKLIDQEKLVNTMLLSTGVMSGFCLMAGTVFEEFKILLGDDTDLYVFISGLAVLIASINQLQQDILSELFSKKGSYAFFAIILIIFSIIMAIYLDVKILQ